MGNDRYVPPRFVPTPGVANGMQYADGPVGTGNVTMREMRLRDGWLARQIASVERDLDRPIRDLVRRVSPYDLDALARLRGRTKRPKQGRPYEA